MLLKVAFSKTTTTCSNHVIRTSMSTSYQTLNHANDHQTQI